jgi:hypothetical protein
MWSNLPKIPESKHWRSGIEPRPMYQRGWLHTLK